MLKCIPAAQRGIHAHSYSTAAAKLCIRNRCMQFRDSRTRWQFAPTRRLLFEELERRDLLAVMRIVDWNTLNGPNDETGDANFRTVLQAIGNETVQGNTQRVDILALQETDPPGNGDSITRIQNVLNTLYSTTSYSLSASPVDGGG